jgi:SecD/SecF fusion protein
MKTKGQNAVGLLLALVLIGALVIVTVFGYGSFGGIFERGSIILGLDLVGGSRIVYEADVDEDYQGDLTEDMAAVSQMLRARLDMLGYTEATAIPESDTGRVVVEIPSVSNPEEAVQMLGATAELTFVSADGDTVLSGGDIVSAKAQTGVLDNTGISRHYIMLTLSEQGTEKFAVATGDAASKASSNENYIAIHLDGKEISRPYVDEKLTTSQCTISGNYTAEEAQYLAGVIDAGRLPFALREIQMDTVGATLGERALHTSLVAGAIGVLLVMLFMIVFYRLPGLIASIALIAYTAIMGLLLCLLRVNLSLPGIAGIVLSIGMAIDANVVIFERMKEELRAGKSTLAAFKAGFKRALTAIIDSNITTVIAAVVLLAFGSGTIKGFAITLLIGVLLSMFSAVVLTRYLLARLVGMRVTNVSLYGLNTKKSPATPSEGNSKKPFSFVAKGRLFTIVAAVVLVIGVASFLLLGFNLDVDFVGGTTLQVEMKEYLSTHGTTEISSALENELTEFISQQSGAIVSSFQRAGNEDGLPTQFIVKTTELDTQAREALYESLSEKYGISGGYVYANNVGAVISSELRSAAIVATLVAVALMLVYITFRFDLSSGLAAVTCLAHDLFVMIVAYSLLQIPMNGTMIAALLTILGYSINATIIVFDRLRENRRYATDGEQAVDTSIRQTLTRSINTSVTTLLTIAMLYLLGVTSIRQFALPLMVGIVAGLFSSVCLAGNLWNFYRKLFKKKA